MQLTAKGDYAVRAMVELAAVAPETRSVARLAETQGISARFLENILVALRHGGLVMSKRGSDGGFGLARSAGEITVADVLRAVEGPLAGVQGQAPEAVAYPGAAGALREVWIAARASLRQVLEHVTVADVAAGDLPPAIRQLVDEPGARKRRSS